MMAGQRPIPRDTAAALTSEVLADCRNLGLLLDRFNPWERAGNKWDLAFHVEERKKIQEDWKWQSAIKWGGEAKGLWLSDQQGDNRTRLVDEPLLRRDHIDKALLEAHRTRWEQLVAHYGADRNLGLQFDLRTVARLVVGLGSDSVLETGMTLHHIYGFPVIPASALKGLARTWALLELAADLGVPALDYEQFQARKGPKAESKRPTPLNQLEALLEAALDTKDEQEREALRKNLDKLKNEPPVKDTGGDILKMNLTQFVDHQSVRDFRAVFGYPARTGGALFFDAVPVKVPELTADVMNVHYPKYYGDEKRQTAPSDDQNPNPVSFLVVAEDALFRFAVGRRQNNTDHDTYAKKARIWLEEALREAGIGAKTAAGYGYFGDRQPAKIDSAEPEPRIPKASPDRQDAGPKPTSPERSEQIKSLADEVMRRLYGDDS